VLLGSGRLSLQDDVPLPQDQKVHGLLLQLGGIMSKRNLPSGMLP
jgi:hypothetical protein